MSENTIVLSRGDKSAEALIRHERSTSRIRYADYVADHGVTLETVPEHVQALANLAGEIRKWEDGAERKAFCTKVRNGLKHHLRVEEDTDDSAESPVYDLTAHGVNTLAEMSDEDVVKAIRAEIAARKG